MSSHTFLLHLYISYLVTFYFIQSLFLFLVTNLVISCCRFFGVENVLLPEIKSSAEIYGKLKEGSLQGLPISGVLGDQQAALVGQTCFNIGQAKNTSVT